LLGLPLHPDLRHLLLMQIQLLRKRELGLGYKRTYEKFHQIPFESFEPVEPAMCCTPV
jgi:hypothetical protein